MSDEGFHEIQLNGKQLVFLFMATTVVVVVVFLCGVLVGRGVRANQTLVAGDVAAAGPADVTSDEPLESSPSESQPEPAAAAPQASADADLSYYKRLENDEAPKEELKTTDAGGVKRAPAAAPVKAQPKVPPTVEAPSPSAAAAPPPGVPVSGTTDGPLETSGDSFAVQVAALRERSEADAIARRLTSKGYHAYVLSPGTGQASMYRVRVGKFKSRRDAEAIVTRLMKEEQFKPWITR